MGGGLALAIIALWATYVIVTMPVLLGGPERKDSASAVDTAAPVSQNDNTGDIFTRSLRRLRDEFSARWSSTRDRIGSLWGDAERSFEAIDQASPAISTP